jgi:5-methylcytosine-specific restriction endonuclease McrA
MILGEFQVDQIVPLLGTGKPKQYFDTKVGQFGVRMSSNRLECLRRNQMCVRCGVVGTLFRLESVVRLPNTGHGCYIQECPWCSLHHKPMPEVETPHFNLYHVAADGKLIMLTQDHILPKSRGGSDDLENLQTMCETCNHNKGSQLDADLHPEDWACQTTHNISGDSHDQEGLRSGSEDRQEHGEAVASGGG